MQHYPKLNSLRLFEAAARHENFRKAAEELNLTQGAVAQAVRGLESDLGVRLFNRHARGLFLTEAGRQYQGEVNSGLAIIDEATRKLLSNPDRITLSVPPSLASKWLVPRLPYFMESHPGIEIRTIATDTLSNFKDDGVDVAIRQGPRPNDTHLSVTQLAPLRFAAVTGLGAAFIKDRVFSEVSDFANVPLIQDYHWNWSRLFKSAGLKPPKGMLQFNQTALAMDAARNGQGVALTPDLLINADRYDGDLVTLWRDPTPTDDAFWLIYPKAGRANRLARDALVDWLLATGPTSTGRDIDRDR